ncbi:ADP-ribosylglycohydrolase family protein [Candidatus Saccharibacteria bacterium]|nr:ADP-ribosylglycohydrolase family protein [Candidatus Saccharibacteria bacterium]
MKPKLQHIGEQLIPAVAYGDAAGLPTETMSHEKIQRLYGRVGRLLLTSTNEYFAGEYAPGTWSDDTQLTIAVANSLVDAGGFDLDSQAAAHVTAFNETPIVEFKGKLKPRGWGGSTVNSMRRIIDGVSPLESGEVDGVGNGILMKLGPLAYWHYVRGTSDEQRWLDCDQLTLMTHNSPIAATCTRVHGDVLQFLLSADEQITPQTFAGHIIGTAMRHERMLGLTGNEISGLFIYMNQADRIAESHILKHTDGKGFYAPQTLAMAYGVFCAYMGNYEAAVYGAVNLGGDTDSIASIVGVMELFASGGIELPSDYIQIDRRTELERISKQFTQTAGQ